MLDQIDDDVGLPRLLGVADGRVGFGDVVHRSGPCGDFYCAGPYGAEVRRATARDSLSPRAGRGWGEGGSPLDADLRRFLRRIASSATLRIAERPPHPRF